MIVLTNDGHGFGFGISGSRNSGAVVRNIFPGGAADRVSVFLCSVCILNAQENSEY